MTVPSSTARADYATNGVSTIFAVPFRFLANSHLLVQRTITATGVSTPLALDSDYTVAGAGANAGGSITTLAAYAAGSTITILRDVPITQLTDYIANDSFPAESHERALDQLTMIAQQLGETTDRAMVLPSGLTGVSVSLPVPVADKLLGWNATANAIENKTPEVVYSGTLLGQQRGSGHLRSIQGKAFERVSILDFIPLAEHAAIIACTSTYDCAPAFAAAIAMFGLVGVQHRGGEIFIPNGDYHVNSTISISKRMTLVGENMGEQAVTAATRLIFPANTTGIRVYSLLESPDGGSGAYTAIRDLNIYGGGSGGASGHGIWASATVHLENVNISNFALNGCQIIADAAGLTGLANLWSIRNCRFASNGQDGFFCQGPDVNAGIAMLLDCSNNGRWGIYDASLLGNTYLACHVNNNARGSYKTTGTVAANVFIGCYVEGAGAYGTEIIAPSVFYGGILTGQNNYPIINLNGDGNNARCVAICNGGQITQVVVFDMGSGYTFCNASILHGSGAGAVLTPVVSGGKVVSVTITNAGAGYIGSTTNFGFKDEGSSKGMETGRLRSSNSRTSPSSRATDVILHDQLDDGITLKTAGSNGRINLVAWNEAVKCWESEYNSSSALGGIRYVGDLSTTETGGRSGPLPAGSIEFPLGYWLGGGSTGRYRGIGTAAPASGEWAKGDHVANSASTVGQPKGWFCTVSGTPGTWVSEGNL